MFKDLLNTLFLLVLLFTGCNIEGTITHNGAPLSGVTVHLGGDASKTTTTAPDGKFIFKDVKPGSYTLTPSLECYTFDAESKNVSITNKNKLKNDFSASFTCTNKCVFNEHYGYYKCSTEVAMGDETIVNRTFIYQEPTTEAPIDGYPILLLFHGAGSSGETWFVPYKRNQSVINFKEMAISEANGYFVIALDANNYQEINSLWPCNSILDINCKPHWCYMCTESEKPEVCLSSSEALNCDEDLVFIEKILDKIAYVFTEETGDPAMCLDPDRPGLQLNKNMVFSTGISSGAAMTIYTAREFGKERIKAASATGGIPDGYEFVIGDPENHPPMMIITGEKDPHLKFNEIYFNYLSSLAPNIASTFLKLASAGHAWISEFNKNIFNWFATYSADE